MAMRWGGFEGWGLRPHPHGFVLPHPRPALHEKQNFPAPSPPLWALRSLAPPRKTLLLVNFPTTIAIIFNKTFFVNKNILEINNKFISSNQTSF